MPNPFGEYDHHSDAIIISNVKAAWFMCEKQNEDEQVFPNIAMDKTLKIKTEVYQ